MNSLPILVKLLDINTKISIQVHPSDEIARLLGEKEPGKDEAWLILDGGRVYIGFRERANKSELSQPRILKKMHRFDAEYLKSFKIPAGIIHYAEGKNFGGFFKLNTAPREVFWPQLE